MADSDRLLDSKTLALWGGAIILALRGDRGALADLLKCDVEMTDDVREFLAWLVDPKIRMDGRPPVPAKFKAFDQMSRIKPDVDKALRKFVQDRAIWETAHPGRQFPYMQELKKLGPLAGAVGARLKRLGLWPRPRRSRRKSGA